MEFDKRDKKMTQDKNGLNVMKIRRTNTMEYIVNNDDVIRLGNSCYKLFEDQDGKFAGWCNENTLAVLYDFKEDSHIVGCQLLKHGSNKNPIEITNDDVLIANFDPNLKLKLSAYPKSQGAGFSMYLDPSKPVNYVYHQNIGKAMAIKER